MEAELKQLQDERMLEPVETADWAAPIVPVLKSDKTSVRICGDFRVSVQARHLPHSQGGGPLCDTQEGEDLYQA